jgi:glycosyltransferase involved in cell wall biosynthesis
MNILFANTQEFNPQVGGVERVSSILAQEFALLGHHTYFLACHKSLYSKEYTTVVPQTMLPDSIKYNSDANIKEFSLFLELNRIEIIINQAGNIKDFSSLCFSAAGIYKQAKVVSVIHIDPICRFKSVLDFSSSILPSQNNYKIIARFIFLPYRILKVYIPESSLYNFVYKNSDQIVLLSEHFKKNFKIITRLSSYNKLYAISNPFPFSSLNTGKEFRKENKILYVGRIDYGHKRVDRILKLWSKLAPEFPTWSLDILGSGPIKKELIEIVKEKQISRVNFIDFADPVEFYKKAQIICVTSTFEGLPMILIEGAHFGCIPIAFNSFSSLHDIIEDGVNGFMIKPYDLSEYEKKLRLLIQNETFRNSMRNNSIDIPNKFQLKVIVKHWIDLFEKILEAKQL